MSDFKGTQLLWGKEQDVSNSEDVQLHCNECGKALFNVDAGAVCPEGHGRIHPPIPRSDHVAATKAMRAEGLPTVMKAGKLSRTIIIEKFSPDWKSAQLYRVSEIDGMWREIHRECRKENDLCVCAPWSLRVFYVRQWEDDTSPFRF